MTRTSITVSMVMAILLAGPVVTYAEAVLYTPDRWHTRIYFTVSHLSVVDQKPATTNIAGPGPGNGHGECGRDSSINGVAALFQYFDAGRRRNRRR